MEKNKMSVKIGGKTYSIVSSESEEYVRRVAEVVDLKMREVADKNQHLNMNLIMLLTSLTIADEHLKTEKDINNMRKQVAEYAKLLDEANAKLDKYKIDRNL